MNDIDKFLDSVDWKKLFEKQEWCAKIDSIWIKKFHNLPEERQISIIQRIKDKYSSPEYLNKEYKLGYEPRTPLYFLLFAYSRVYGEDLYLQYCEKLDFCGGIYKINSYIIELMIGQGSVINLFDEKEFNDYLNRLEKYVK